MAAADLKKDKNSRETERKEIRLSVRAFVEFLLRNGDFDGRRGGWADREAMQAGARIHRKIQKSRGAAYRAEVPLVWKKEYSDHTLVIEGRADGIFEEGSLTVIEEIKGIYADLDTLREAVPVHLAQARCYAYIHALENRLKRVGICMTYVQMETEEKKQFRTEETFEELEEWFLALVDAFRPWAEFRISWEKKRNASLHDLEFPFLYRPGQQGLTADIYRTILRKKQVFVQAPTGVGKTVSAVYPAVRALGEGLAERICYLTAKTITRTVAEETFGILRDSGMACKTLSMTAKEKICPLARNAEQEDDPERRDVTSEEKPGTGPVCTPDVCPYAKGHYDRINRVLYETVTEYDIWNRDRVLAQAEAGKVCPYELQSDLAAFSDALIGDYNYVFDPAARLRQFFGEGHSTPETIFLIDEAHNLVDRAREMFSADLYREEFLALRRVLSKEKTGPDKRLRSALQSCLKILLELRRRAEEQEVLPSVGELIIPLMNLTAALEERLQETEDGALREQMLAFYFRVTAFLSVSDLLDERYIIYGVPLGKNDLFLKLFCVDPSLALQQTLDKGRSAVFFSATLVPVRYYRSLLSCRGEEDYAITIPSPFPKENRLILVGRDVSTRYRRRTESEFKKIAEYIRRAVSAKTGNYIVYFPSYQLLDQVLEAFLPCDHFDLLIQSRDMREEEREQFLQSFRTPGERTRIGFCVMGGIFAEGIDLRGEDLIGAVVVGTGLPQVGRERELLMNYYKEDGFAYAYRNPGMNKVLQAAGRVIRTPEDRGWILLLDERFLHREYDPCFPPSWSDRKICTLQTVEKEIRDFWKANNAVTIL